MNVWRLKSIPHYQLAELVTLHGRIKIDSASGILAAAATAGFGIANVTTMMSAQERRDGSLIQLLPDHELEPLKAFAVYPSGPRPSAKVQALVATLLPYSENNALSHRWPDYVSSNKHRVMSAMSASGTQRMC